MDNAERRRYEAAFQEACRVFGNPEDAQGWLNEPSIPLGVTPMSLLVTDDGLNTVLYELAQMEYGHPV